MYSLALRCARSLSLAEKAAQPRSGNASHNCIQQQERCHRTKNVGLALKHAMTCSNLAHPETTSFWHFICQRGLTVISTDNGFAFERRKISHPQHVLAAQVERKTRKAFADKCFAVAKAQPFQSVFSSWRTNFTTEVVVLAFRARTWVFSSTVRRSLLCCRDVCCLGVRLTPKDWEFLSKAAAKLWPGALLSKSSLILSLARLAAEQALKTPRKRS